MLISISVNAVENGQKAALKTKELIDEAIRERGEARIVVSTGMSQFEFLSSLISLDIDWSKVVLFHLDEYVGLTEEHPASFRRYLKERLISKVSFKSVHLVSGEGDITKNIEDLSLLFREKQIDVALVGIGENSHIAFNDPPADFLTDEIYRIVELDEKCRMQQVGEGWFKSVDEVPKEAISMMPKAIMSARHIVSVVPHSVKAEAIKRTITEKVSNKTPATLLKTHPDWYLFVDKAAASSLLSM